MRQALTVGALALLLLGAAPVGPADAHSCPADPALSELVAGSDLIAVATLDTPVETLTAEAWKQSPGYVAVPFAVADLLKGAPVAATVIQVYPRDLSYAPSMSALADRSGKPSLLFLLQPDSASGHLYFAGDTPAALGEAGSERVAAVFAEIARQKALLAAWTPDHAVPHHAEVRALIDRLAASDGSDQQAIFDRIEALGASAVPAIIAQMDDFRPLARAEMKLRNHRSGASEAYRSYGPRVIVDALAAILNQLTAKSFGTPIHNGGSERERRATVAGWRVHAANMTCGAAAD